MTPLDWITTEQAKQQWCPASMTTQSGVAVNRLNSSSKEEIPTKCKCLAEECANWEWQTEGHEKGRCCK